MTHTAKHTPGPWVVTEHSAGMICVAGPDHKDLCAVGYNRTEGRDDAANATLIAAAPVMFEALREAQELIRSLVAEEMIHSSELQRVGNCQANMWEALAQAEGGGHE